MSETMVSARPSLWRFICDRNPFYLLSAIFMLFGCIALTHSDSPALFKLHRLIILIGMLNFYEALLIGLAIYLITRRGLRRDGNILLLIEAFILVDVTFLNSEIFSTNLRIGLIVNAGLLALAFIKLAAIFCGLGLPLIGGRFALALVEMATVLALPGIYQRISLAHNGGLPASIIYFSWWAVGAAVPVLAWALLRQKEYPDPARQLAFRQSRHVAGALIILPIISLLAHLCTINWIYDVHWYVANASPLFLGLAIAIGGCDTHVRTLGVRMKWQFVLPILALVLSAESSPALVFRLGGVGLSPLRLSFLGAMLVYLHGLWLHRHILFAWALCVCVGSAGLGMSMQQILNNLTLIWEETTDFIRRLTPRTLTHWGVISVVAAFLLLLLGAMASLSKPRPVEMMDDPPDFGE